MAVDFNANVTSTYQIGASTYTVGKSSEDKLSAKAKDYLENLRKDYKDVDFVVADAGDDKKTLAKSGTKDSTVLFSSAEYERMARDEKYAKEKLRTVDTAIRKGNQIAEEYGAVYEKGSDSSKGLYSINKMSQSDRTTLVNQLKSDMEQRKSQLMSLVQKTLSGQVGAYGKATGNDLWKTLASGNFTVDAATKKQAQEDISEDGYWGVKKTSQRLFDFASALAGDDVNKMKEMQAAMEKGFKQATKAWGRELPSISKDTLSAANKLFEDYYASKNEVSAD